MGLAFIISGTILLIWGYWPNPRQARSIPLAPQEGLAVPLKLTLEWPSLLREGDRGRIRLLLAEAVPAGRGEVEPILLEAHLELPGAQFSPPGEISQGLLPGREAIFQWLVEPQRAGEFRGTVWVYSLPPAGNAPVSRRTALSAQMFEFRTNRLFGLDTRLAQVTGIVLTALSLVFLLAPLVSRWAQRLVKESHSAG